MEEQTLTFNEDTYKITLKIGAKGQITGEVSTKAATIEELQKRTEEAMMLLLSYSASES